MNTTRGFQALGFAFRFESNDPDLVHVIDRCYSGMPANDREPNILRAMTLVDTDVFEVTLEALSGDVQMCEPTVSRAGVVSVIAWEVNHRAEESRASWSVMHATVTAGPSGAGALGDSRRTVRHRSGRAGIGTHAEVAGAAPEYAVEPDRHGFHPR